MKQYHLKEKGLSATVLALNCYDSKIRDLIIQAKVCSDRQSVKEILGMMDKDLPIGSGKIFVPAASSLKSKFTGKTDVAFLIASQLAHLFRGEVRLPPLCMQFRFFKQTECKNRARHSSAVRLKNKIEGLQETIVIVDDVMSTGRTITQLAHSLGMTKVDAFVFAYNQKNRSNKQG